MKIFPATQMKEWDAATITVQDILPVQLIERAATACYNWLILNDRFQKHFHIFCGKGNNGGDGLALANLLLENKQHVTIYILELGRKGSDEFQYYLQKIHKLTSSIHFIQSHEFFPEIKVNDIIIDALMGTGLNRPLENIAKALVEFINSSPATVISIDTPSGLLPDKSTKNFTAVNADHTLTFQQYKLAFLLPENEKHCGKVHLLNIGLDKAFEETHESVYEMPDEEIIKNIIRPRGKFSHKGDYGHACIIAGSYGMMGAAVLAAKGTCMSGAGKLTCYVPGCGYGIMQASVPEALCIAKGDRFIDGLQDLDHFDSVGAGPGLGNNENTNKLLFSIFMKYKKPLLLDADMLNIIAADKTLLKQVPSGSVITPHPKEFERLFGKTTDDFEQLNLAMAVAKEFHIYIVLKGYHTFICTPFGKGYFNNSGNSGMAKGGTGDVLSGIITGLMAQHYPLPEAAILGVYLHGLAGDFAAKKYTPYAMQASHLVECIPEAWKKLTD
ncbi:MAG TPA: NAD(P)H-hydrate dehydratase [Ferruginibacter sp.]|nr:NAD(P)H-hydrate dehydratase [Ferruginibacter sp.]